MAQINVESGTGFSTAVLIADLVQTPKGSNDSTAQFTQVNGETASVAFEIQSVLGAALFPRVTTAVMNSFVATNGMIVYNTTAQAFYGYINGAWAAIAYIGADIGLTAGLNIVLTPNPITSSGTIALSTTLTSLISVAVGNMTLLSSNINSTGSLIFGTNGTTTALTLNASQNALFAGTVTSGNITLSTSNVNSTGSLFFGTNGSTTALTLNTSQNALFAGTVTVGSLTLNSNILESSGSLILATNGTTTALTLDTSQNATFVGNVILSGTKAVEAGSVILLSSGGGNIIQQAPVTASSFTYTWPSAYPISSGYILASTAAGVLSWILNEETTGTANTLAWFNASGILASNTNVTVTSGGAITTTSTMKAGNITLTGSTVESSGSLILATNGTTTALTLDTSQNATFIGSINAPLNINLTSASSSNGIFSSTATSSSGGIYMDSVSGNLHFAGGTTSNAWSFYDSNARQLLYIFNAGSTTNSIGISAGALVLQSIGGSVMHISPTSMSSSYTLTWPGTVASSNGQVLTSTTGGALSWTTPTTGTVTSITQGTNMSFSVSPITTTGVINLSSTLTGLTSAVIGSLTLSGTSINSSGQLTLGTNGTTTALTLNTSQNATFANLINIPTNVNLTSASSSNGLFSSNATASAGGVYFDSVNGNLMFKGGTSGNNWSVYGSTGNQLLYVFNVGSNTNSIGISAGNLVLQSNQAIQLTAPTSGVTGYTLTFPAAAPATSGSVLSSTTGGALSWQSPLLNTAQTANNTLYSTSSTTFVATGFSASITPQSTSSKILILVTANMYVSSATSANGFLTVYRNSTNLGSVTQGFQAIEGSSALTSEVPASISYIDSPATTSSVTYQLYFRVDAAGATLSLSFSSTNTVISLIELFI